MPRLNDPRIYSQDACPDPASMRTRSSAYSERVVLVGTRELLFLVRSLNAALKPGAHSERARYAHATLLKCSDVFCIDGASEASAAALMILEEGKTPAAASPTN